MYNYDGLNKKLMMPQIFNASIRHEIDTLSQLNIFFYPLS